MKYKGLYKHIKKTLIITIFLIGVTNLYCVIINQYYTKYPKLKNIVNIKEKTCKAQNIQKLSESLNPQ